MSSGTPRALAECQLQTSRPILVAGGSTGHGCPCTRAGFSYRVCFSGNSLAGSFNRRDFLEAPNPMPVVPSEGLQLLKLPRASGWLLVFACARPIVKQSVTISNATFISAAIARQKPPHCSLFTAAVTIGDGITKRPYSFRGINPTRLSSSQISMAWPSTYLRASIKAASSSSHVMMCGGLLTWPFWSIL